MTLAPTRPVTVSPGPGLVPDHWQPGRDPDRASDSVNLKLPRPPVLGPTRMIPHTQRLPLAIHDGPSPLAPGRLGVTEASNLPAGSGRPRAGPGLPRASHGLPAVSPGRAHELEANRPGGDSELLPVWSLSGR